MNNNDEHHLPFRIALLWILLISVFICGSFSIGYLYYKKVQKSRYQQPQYNIVAIVQTTPDKEKLKTVFFSELLNLSVDRPTNILNFNAKKAQHTLQSLPMISSVSVKKVLPGTLYVDYTLRKPIAYLIDYTNTVIDHEGVPFPLKPFFTPKKLPEIYLGLSDNFKLVMGKPIQAVQCKLGIYLIDLINKHCCLEKTNLVRVDVSKVIADSYGQRQIIVILEDQIERKGEQGTRILIVPQILRLSVDHYRQELGNYLALRAIALEQASASSDEESKVVRAKPVIIDLRIAELAYITKGKD